MRLRNICRFRAKQSPNGKREYTTFKETAAETTSQYIVYKYSEIKYSEVKSNKNYKMRIQPGWRNG